MGWSLCQRSEGLAPWEDASFGVQLCFSQGENKYFAPWPPISIPWGWARGLFSVVKRTCTTHRSVAGPLYQDQRRTRNCTLRNKHSTHTSLHSKRYITEWCIFEWFICNLVCLQWEVCSAREVSNSSQFTPSEKPSGFTCQVTKRCVCISCTAGPLTTGNPNFWTK